MKLSTIILAIAYGFLPVWL